MFFSSTDPAAGFIKWAVFLTGATLPSGGCVSTFRGVLTFNHTTAVYLQIWRPLSDVTTSQSDVTLSTQMQLVYSVQIRNLDNLSVGFNTLHFDHIFK